MSSRIQSLGLLEKAIWQELQRAGGEREHEFRRVTLATRSGDGADARVVVVREVLPEQHQLVIYTDARSLKVQQIQQHPVGTVVAWSPSLQWQLRLSVRLQVADSGLDVSSRWARVKLSSAAQDYLAALPPGTPVDRHEPERSSREHFAVVKAEVTLIDWLELHPEGHRRARFDASGFTWLAP